MPNARKKNKRPPPKMEDIPLTPMIDVVFQLLIYFVFTFEPIDIFAHLEVYRPAADKSATTDTQPEVVRINVFPDGYTINGRVVSKESLLNILFRMSDLDPNQTVIIQPTANSPHAKLIELLDMCTQAGLNKFSIISAD
ncbi:MAG: biopolymer transport protein ExbD [Kiritimatiellia bacterium]|jgi:biopolymer transport protein ExbD